MRTWNYRWTLPEYPEFFQVTANLDILQAQNLDMPKEYLDRYGQAPTGGNLRSDTFEETSTNSMTINENQAVRWKL